jgi:hypothetical protein
VELVLLPPEYGDPSQQQQDHHIIHSQNTPSLIRQNTEPHHITNPSPKSGRKPTPASCQENKTSNHRRAFGIACLCHTNEINCTPLAGVAELVDAVDSKATEQLCFQRDFLWSKTKKPMWRNW